jgi:hypothetical protein
VPGRVRPPSSVAVATVIAGEDIDGDRERQTRPGRSWS